MSHSLARRAVLAAAPCSLALLLAGLGAAPASANPTQPASSCNIRIIKGETVKICEVNGATTVEYLGSSTNAPKNTNTAHGTTPTASEATPPAEPPCVTHGTGVRLECTCLAISNEVTTVTDTCQAIPDAPTGPQAPVKPLLDTIREAAASLALPDGVPIVAPDPANNEWNMIPIGYPIWLTTTAPATASATTTHDGITITIDATRRTTTFHMGEPVVKDPTVTCTGMTQRRTHEYPANKKSPDCGYTYQHQGTYTITATTTWRLAWTANGHTGTLDITRDAPAAKPLDIRQLKAVIVSAGP